MPADTLPLATRAPARRSRVSLWSALCAAWRARCRRADDLRLLREMSSRDLLDLGLSRGDIERIVGR